MAKIICIHRTILPLLLTGQLRTQLRLSTTMNLSPVRKYILLSSGQYLTFEEVDDHVYKMESPDGTNVYTYMNGICTEVKVSRDFAKFYFRMAPETFYAIENQVDSIVGGN